MFLCLVLLVLTPEITGLRLDHSSRVTCVGVKYYTCGSSIFGGKLISLRPLKVMVSRGGATLKRHLALVLGDCESLR